MNKLRIPHQILSAHALAKIDPDSKVICITPEKILDPKVMREISQLEWSCICIDEPHLALIWGTSKTKLTKPFRDAFSKLSRLNNLTTCFELHSATIFDESKIFKLLGRKNSKWVKQIQLPNRENLTVYVIAGKNAPDNILSLPSVKNAFDNKDGLLLIFVQRISDGSSIHLELLEYCEENGYVRFCPKKEKPYKPIAFLHSSLSEDSKRRILTDAGEKNLRVLIATNSAGCGINIPVTEFIGWGLDPEPCGIIQAMGRTCRKPVTTEGAVIWIHNPRLHGRRVTGKSKVRELLSMKGCLRKISNDWFSHGLNLSEEKKPDPEFCCSWCMGQCVKERNCVDCNLKLRKFIPIPSDSFDHKVLHSRLTNFLKQVKVNEQIPDTVFPYKEESLSQEIMNHIQTTNSTNDLADFLHIFGFGKSLIQNILAFMTSEMRVPTISKDINESENESDSCSTSQSEDESLSEVSSEYFDEEDSECV